MFPASRGLRGFCLAALATLSLAVCPNEDATLKKWSESATWASGAVPVEGEAVTVSEPVLLDTTTPDLLSVTIATGGRLVFDPTVELAKLSTEWVLVSGDLVVGSEDCPFAGQAEIELLGLKNETEGVTIGDVVHQKAIVVDTGSLEIHGEVRKPWARLETTLPKTTRELVTGSPLYDHKGSESDVSWYRGFIGYQFGADGQPVHHLRPRRSCEFAELVTMEDSIVVLVVQRRVELDNGQDLEQAAIAFETVCLGGQRSHLRDLALFENTAWAAICHVGHPENSVEELGHQEGEDMVTSRLSKQIGDKEFVAFSRTRPGADWHFKIDLLSYTAGEVPHSHIVLNMDSDVSSWRAGDKIAITSTDYDWRQAEELELQECAECTANQIKLGFPIEFTHWGETTDGVNMGAEIGLLNRKVRIYGRMEDACYGDNRCNSFSFDTFGGQIRILADFQTARIANAEIFHMGQNSVLGSYPIHFHMCGDLADRSATVAYVRSNSIHHTFARCLTVHGTSGLLVEDNMAFDHYGHCFFLEDGAEQRTVFRRNLGFSTRRTSLTHNDRDASTFWITNPDTTMEGNVAGGSERFGFWYVFPRKPIGPSAALNLLEENQAFRTPLGPFVDNVAHSNEEYGLRFDGVLRPNGHIWGGFNYNPLENPLDATSPAVMAVFDGFTGFKNYKSVWLRGPQVEARRFKIAESVEGITFAYSYPGVKKLKDSLIVGETANKGKPEGNIRLANGTVIYWDRQIRMNGADNALPIIGVIFYEPIVALEGVTFDRFQTNIVRPSAAIGIRRQNREYSSPVSSVSGATFRYSDPSEGNRFYDASEGRGFADRAGNIQHVIQDLDGSLTTYPGSSIVKPYDIHLNARCVEVPQWNMYVCPTKFTKLKYLWGDGSVNPLRTFLTRNDGSATFGQQNYQISYALNAQESYIVNFNTTVPRYFKLRLAGVEEGVVQTVGVCIGRDVVPVNIETNAVPVPDFESLGSDGAEVRYFHDPAVGILFFRFISPYARTPETVDECPGMEGEPSGCPTVFVELPAKNDDGDCSERAYPTYSTVPLDSTGALTLPDFSVGDTK